ncbi:hypothetical protein [Vibrio sinaloensis]|uniref:hypothetical protein n=2 Tax=Photobacterium sp. (strain ATCC 43367) TaxID=379097 RepID=UPI002F4111A4
MKVKYKVSITFFLACSLLLIVNSLIEISISLKLNSSRTIIERLANYDQPSTTDLNNALLMLDSVLAKKRNSGYELELAGLASLWQQYINSKGESYETSERYFKLSISIRPTWPNSYVELSKIYMFNKDNVNFEKYRLLANKFGPSYPPTKMLNVNYVFSSWDERSRKEQVDAARQLLELTNNWGYRTQLDKMIHNSRGKQRICNILVFNDVNISECPPSL